MKKRILALIIALIIVLSGTTAYAANVKDFTDVKSDDWFYPAVEYCAENNLFSGTNDYSFSPNQPMTRGMFVTVIGRQAEVPKDYGRWQDSPFDDMTHLDYYHPFAVWAYDNNIVNGTGVREFSPTEPISREQMATMLFNYAKFLGADITLSDTAYNSFPDSTLVSTYAVIPMKWATTHKVINGIGNTLSPKTTANRAQVAQIFFNSKDILNETEPSDPEVPSEPDDKEYSRKTGKSAVDSQGGYYDYDLANEIMDLIDELRVQNGAKPLAYHPYVQSVADIRSKELVTLFSHTRPDGSSCFTAGLGITGENCHWHSPVDSDSATRVVNAYMNSTAGHRESMLSTGNKTAAVSVYINGGKLYTAHEFSWRGISYFDSVQ